MLKEVLEINEQGFIVEKYVGEFIEGDLITDFGDKSMVLTDLPQPSYYIKPRWNGSEWIEGETEVEQTEREAKEQLESLLPSLNEIADAELEIKVISLLNELGVLV